jgi:hypothetical protein
VFAWTLCIYQDYYDELDDLDIKVPPTPPNSDVHNLEESIFEVTDVKEEAMTERSLENKVVEPSVKSSLVGVAIFA